MKIGILWTLWWPLLFGLAQALMVYNSTDVRHHEVTQSRKPNPKAAGKFLRSVNPFTPPKARLGNLNSSSSTRARRDDGTCWQKTGGACVSSMCDAHGEMAYCDNDICYCSMDECADGYGHCVQEDYIIFGPFTITSSAAPEKGPLIPVDDYGYAAVHADATGDETQWFVTKLPDSPEDPQMARIMLSPMSSPHEYLHLVQDMTAHYGEGYDASWHGQTGFPGVEQMAIDIIQISGGTQASMTSCFHEMQYFIDGESIKGCPYQADTPASCPGSRTFAFDPPLPPHVWD